MILSIYSGKLIPELFSCVIFQTQSNVKGREIAYTHTPERGTYSLKQFVNRNTVIIDIYQCILIYFIQSLKDQISLCFTKEKHFKRQRPNKFLSLCEQKFSLKRAFNWVPSIRKKSNTEEKKTISKNRNNQQ